MRAGQTFNCRLAGHFAAGCLTRSVSLGWHHLASPGLNPPIVLARGTKIISRTPFLSGEDEADFSDVYLVDKSALSGPRLYSAGLASRMSAFGT
jgi:hypothetical protein